MTRRTCRLSAARESSAAEGVTLDALDDALGRLLDDVRAAGADDETEEIINNVGDRLHGWCHESRHIQTRPAADTDANGQPSAPSVRPAPPA
jgi:hypothetical protein